MEAHAGAGLNHPLGLRVGVAPGPALHLGVELGRHGLPGARVDSLLVHPLAGLQDQLRLLLARLAAAGLLVLVTRVALAHGGGAGKLELEQATGLLRLAPALGLGALARAVLLLAALDEVEEGGGEVEAKLRAHERVEGAVARANRGGVGVGPNAGRAHLLRGVEVPAALAGLALPHRSRRLRLERIPEIAAAADAHGAQELVIGIPGKPARGIALAAGNVRRRHFQAWGA